MRIRIQIKNNLNSHMMNISNIKHLNNIIFTLVKDMIIKILSNNIVNI